MIKQGIEREEIERKILNNKIIDGDEERFLVDAIIKSKSFFQDHTILLYVRKIKNQQYLEEIASRARLIETRIRAVRNIESQEILKRIARLNDAPSVRIAAIDRIDDVEFLAQIYINETNKKIKRKIWKRFISKHFIFPKPLLDDISKINDKEDLGIVIEAISNIQELRKLALERNFAKRVTREIPKIKDASLLRFLIAYKTIGPSNIKKWTDMVVNLDKDDLEIAKRIFLERKKYSFADIDAIDSDKELFEILMDTTSENIQYSCVSKIKSLQVLKRIIESTNSSFIRFCAEERLNKVKTEKASNKRKEENGSSRRHQ